MVGEKLLSQFGCKGAKARESTYYINDEIAELIIDDVIGTVPLAADNEVFSFWGLLGNIDA